MEQTFAAFIQGKTISAVDDGLEWVKIKFTDGTQWHFRSDEEIEMALVNGKSN